MRWGSVYRGIVRRIHPSSETAEIEISPNLKGSLHNRDVFAPGTERGSGIGKRLKTGQTVIVQAKESILSMRAGSDTNTLEIKSPRLTMHIGLQGRYLVYMPLAGENKVSQRIRDKKLRRRLQDMMAGQISMQGLILRSSAADIQTDIIEKEAAVLHKQWDAIEKLSTGSGKHSAQLLQGPNAIQRLLSNLAEKPIERIEVVTLDHLEAVQTWCRNFAPDISPRIIPVEISGATNDLRLFEHRDILKQIEALFSAYTLLKGGGNLIIQETAALTAIDINRGSDKQSNLNLNIHAAKEIARQLRLRNIGGIIVIDFLKMKSAADEKKLKEAMTGYFDDDQCTVQLHGLTNLGLYELTRQQRTASLQDRMKSVTLT